MGNGVDDPVAVTLRSACAGWMDTAESDHAEVALRVSDMVTLGDPTRVEPKP